MSEIGDYLGRTVDLAAYLGMQPGGERQLTAALCDADNSGYVVSGIQKLVQRFLLLLLTEKGSIPHLPDRGCEFMQEARAGVFATVFDVMTAFSSSLVDISQQLRDIETTNDPDDERFSNASLENVELAADKVSLRIQLVSLAGTTYEFLTPLPLRV